MLHDGTYLYVAVSTPLSTGWDSKARLRIDGDNSGTLNGSTSSPYVDIQTEKGAPTAWSGYTNYQALTGGASAGHVAPGAGEARASAGSAVVAWEWRVPLDDLGLLGSGGSPSAPPGAASAPAEDYKRIRLVVTVSPDDRSMWFWPRVDATTAGLDPIHPEVWQTCILEGLTGGSGGSSPAPPLQGR